MHRWSCRATFRVAFLRAAGDSMLVLQTKPQPDERGFEDLPQDRQLVADQLAAAGEDRRRADQALAVLLAAADREPPA